jgi:transcriptional regulator with XRE-family HTH domain
MPGHAPVLEYVRVRWAKYLGGLLAQADTVSSTQVADVAGVSTSRVSQWRKGTRAVSADTAFDLGERLSDSLALPTSGPAALFACGYAAELIDLMTHLSIDRAANGHTLAVAMYATLPYYFRDFEQELAGSMLTGRASRGATVYEHELANIIGSKFLKRECSDEHEKVTTLARESSVLLSTSEARATIYRAWNQHQSGRYVAAVEPTNNRRFQVSTTATIDVATLVGELAGRRRLDEPTTSLPRLWRLLAEWAYIADEKTLSRYADIIPDPYVAIQARIARDDYEQLILKDLGAQAAYDQMTG